jgi:exodeoxyribonuclease III
VRIATWNVNSLRARLDRVVSWLDLQHPDLVCLQETKVADEEFPRAPFEERGWRVEAFGQRTWNGVALLSREPVDDVARGFPDCAPGTGCRVIGGRFRGIRLLNLYVPNGQEVGTEKYAMKLAWMDALIAWVASTWDRTAPAVICGDFNVTPEDRDVFDGERHRGKILCSEPERERFAKLLALGFSDGFRMFNDQPKQYTYWDYGQVMFPRNLGYRLDHFLLSKPVAERCTSVTVDREERARERPSDHAPVVAEIGDA